MNSAHFADASLELNRHIVNLLDSLSALYSLTDIALDDIGEEELLKRALEALMQNQDMERCSIFLLDDQGALFNAAGRDWDDLLKSFDPQPRERRAASSRRFRLGEGIMGQAASSGEFAYCRSCADDPQFVTLRPDDTPVVGSLICIPIKADKEVLGVLNVFHPEPHFFNHWHERLMILFGKMLGRLLMSHRLLHHISQIVEKRTEQLRNANDRLEQEIIERKKAQESLAQQHQFLQNVVDNSSEPIMVIGADYRIQLMNQAAESNVREEDRGGTQYCYKVLHHRDTPCNGEEHDCPLDAVFKTNAAVTMLHEHFTADGEPRLIELLASPLRDEEGNIAGIIESARDVTERALKESQLKQQHQQLKHQVHHDHLTGLPNRMLFHTHLYHTLDALGEGEMAALLFLDLDGFKPMNDRYGHQFGDLLLQAVAKRLRHHTREQDMVARFAGDEFTILLAGLKDENEAGQVAEHLIRAVSRPYSIEQHKARLSVSIGISLFPTDTRDPDTLISNADIAMYRAKEQGKGAYSYYGDS